MRRRTTKKPTSQAVTQEKKQQDEQDVIIPGPIEEELKSPPKEEQPQLISKEELLDEAKQRAKQRPLLQKIMEVVKRERTPFREIIINSEPLERRVAVLEDGVLQRFEVERTGEKRMVGAIFKGKIQNHELGLKAAFVDIGQPKNAFLHYWDILPESVDAGVEFIRENRSQKQKQQEPITQKDIPKHYPIGKDIVIQITKAQIGTKGPRVTTNLSLPGRFLVLTPYTGQCGISRKIEDRKERDRLKKILRSLTLPEGMGVIIRTAGEGKKIRYFIRDLHLLLKKWEHICETINCNDKPCLLDEEPGILERTVRDFLTEDIDRILVDNAEDEETIKKTLREVSPRSASKVSRFKDSVPIFERFNIERQIEQTFMRKVPLPSGGEIVIEETEALTAIDVNTGGQRGNKDGKDFILNANIEAAIEACRQVRLRNIGGLIIIDFIDMKNRKDRNKVLDAMFDAVAQDKARTHILPISQLGILQMSRQRQKESMSSGVNDPCPYCSGRGTIKSIQSLSIELQRRMTGVLRRMRAQNPQGETLQLRVLLHPDLLERLRKEDEHLLIEIETKYNAHLSFRANPSYHMENFKVVDPVEGRELR